MLTPSSIMRAILSRKAGQIFHEESLADLPALEVSRPGIVATGIQAHTHPGKSERQGLAALHIAPEAQVQVRPRRASRMADPSHGLAGRDPAACIDGRTPLHEMQEGQ